jgi:hypothetical protein
MCDAHSTVWRRYRDDRGRHRLQGGRHLALIQVLHDQFPLPTSTRHFRDIADLRPAAAFMLPQMAESQLNHAVTELIAEPLFELSLSSRELFHSNFISWLIRTHQGAGFALVDQMFGHPGDPRQILRADRESKNVDLHIHSFSGDDIWVEMKIGAIPTHQQLIGYRDALRNESKAQRFHLLSLHDTGSLPPGWELRTIVQLADALDNAAQWVEPQFDRDLVLHEAVLLRALITMADASDPTKTRGGPWFLAQASRQLLLETRTNTLVEKLRAGMILDQLRRRETEKAAVLGSAAGFSNGTGLVEYRRFLPDGRSIGWQLQDDRYKLFAAAAPVARGAAAAHIDIEPCDLPTLSDWFSFDAAEGILGPGVLRLGPRASGEGRYGTEFVYLYRQLPKEVRTDDVLKLLHAETARLAHTG